MTTDDEQWLDLIGGRAAEGASAATWAEALLWRAAAVRWSTETGQPRPIDAQEIDALVARARASGVLPAADEARRRAPSGWRDRLRRWLQPPRMAAALALGVAVLAVGPLLREAYLGRGAAVFGERSGPNAVVVLRVADPEATKARLIRDLGEAGVKAVGYSRFGRAGIDADLPNPLTPSIDAVLDRYGLAAPGDQVLRVEFERVVP